jgi:hypothetical protein
MISKIPPGQKCQAFDPMMTLEGKTADSRHANTSCFCPAYIYLEGSRGKRFLCDFHYVYEKNMTNYTTPGVWPDIEQYIVNEIDSIADSFDKNNNEEVDGSCWCSAKAYVRIKHKESIGSQFYCNFHYRKRWFRDISNNVDISDMIVIDDRMRMDITPTEEINRLVIF